MALYTGSFVFYAVILLAQCSTTVWLDSEGNCENGHPANCFSGVYEAEAQHPPLMD